MTVVDLRDATDPVAAADAWREADFAVPFDLEEAPLFRYALLRLGDEHWVWYHCYHHIAVDGFSCSLIAARVADTYTALVTGTAHTPPEAPSPLWSGRTRRTAPTTAARPTAATGPVSAPTARTRSASATTPHG